SGPLLDRIDLHVEVPALSAADLQSDKPVEDSATVRERVLAARQRQRVRQGYPNQLLEGRWLEQYAGLEPAAETLLARSMKALGLSARAYHRIVRIARTIADLGESERVQEAHVLEAVSLRALDRPAQTEQAVATRTT
ncbi:MAG: ATP-binding protein, partial [Gammaproteobacteria bacterium]